eukprot:scaffold29.g5964.t1
MGRDSTMRYMHLLMAAVVAVMVWEALRSWHRGSGWRLLRRRQGEGLGSMDSLVASAAVKAEGARQSFLVHHMREDCKRKQERQRECQGWQGANAAAEGAEDGWRSMASLRNAALDAAVAAQAEAGGGGKQALARAVALLFLSRGTLPHAEIWQRWMEDAAGRLPRRHAAAFGCSPGAVELLRQACGSGVAGPGAIANAYHRQHLFSIHIHSPPDSVDDYPATSIFSKRTIACRIQPSWGTHDLVEAQRLLYMEALQDPLVQRLSMVSEAGIPLYPAPLVWAQLMAENRSRLNSCQHGENYERATPRLWGTILRPQLWRKSSQWSTLLRSHAELVVRDEEVNALFARHCYMGSDPFVQGWKGCASDEHYIPTLMAYLHRSSECDCHISRQTQSSHTYAQWLESSKFDGHPASFDASDVSPQLLHRMRREVGVGRSIHCPDDSIAAAMSSIDGAFVDADSWTQEQCAAVNATEHLPPTPERLPEGSWECIRDTHWSPAKDGKCCNPDESFCNLGAVLVRPSPEAKHLDLNVSGYAAMPPGLCFLMARKFKPNAMQKARQTAFRAAVLSAALLAAGPVLLSSSPLYCTPVKARSCSKGVRKNLGAGGGAIRETRAAAPEVDVGVAGGAALFRRIQTDFAPFEAGIDAPLVEQAYCQGTHGSFRLQVVNRSAYVVGETKSYESRHLNLKRQLLQLWQDGRIPEGIDLVIESEDLPTVRPRGAGCPRRGPVLAAAKDAGNASHSHVILAPDHTFAGEGWLEARTLAWAEQLPLQRAAAERWPWTARARRLFFRGAATGERNLTSPDLSDEFPDLLDVRLVNWSSVEERALFVPLVDHCQHRLLLHLPGNSYAARLKYLLACGSAVVFAANGYEEFWYHLLEPGSNYFKTEEVDEYNAGFHLAEVAAWLQANDAEAERAGRAAAELAVATLAPAMVAEYWRRLLGAWRRLQSYNATQVHPDAVLLDSSVLVPRVINVTQRTCPDSCPAFNTMAYWRERLLPAEGEPPDGPPASGGSDGSSRREPMADDEREEYHFFGTPIGEETETRAGQHRKEVQDAAATKALPLHKQEVTDAQGRRRFHGAFTGGFSAGYFNTVGSKEGWAPSSFRSSRDARAQVAQSVEQFLDEDELEELRRTNLQTTADYDTFGSTGAELARRVAEEETQARPSAIPGLLPEEVVAPVPAGAGIQLLQRMGWRQGKGIGGSAEEEDGGAEEGGEGGGGGRRHRRAWGREAGVGPENTPLHLLAPKSDTFGLGYDPFRGAEEFRSAKQAQQQQVAGGREGQRGGAGAKRRRGIAFGTGVFDEDDAHGILDDYVTHDDVESYEHEAADVGGLSMKRGPKLSKSGLGDRLAKKGYSFEITEEGEDEERGLLGWHPHQPRQQQYALPGREAPMLLTSKEHQASRGLVPGFIKATATYAPPYFPPPHIPPGYVPRHRVEAPPPPPGACRRRAAAPAPPAAPPPADPQLRQAIDSLAFYVARNGPLFEGLAREKQRREPGAHSFLTGGEGSAYYAWKLHSMRSIIRGPQQAAAPAPAPAARPAISQRSAPLSAEERGALLGEAPLPAGAGAGPAPPPTLYAGAGAPPAQRGQQPSLQRQLLQVAEADRQRLQQLLKRSFVPAESTELLHDPSAAMVGLRPGAPPPPPRVAAGPVGPDGAAPAPAGGADAAAPGRIITAADLSRPLPDAATGAGGDSGAGAGGGGGGAPRLPVRRVEDWRPLPLLCKRFNVPDPYHNRPAEVQMSRFKTDHLTLPETAARVVGALGAVPPGAEQFLLPPSVSAAIQAAEVTQQQQQQQQRPTAGQPPLPLLSPPLPPGQGPGAAPPPATLAAQVAAEAQDAAGAADAFLDSLAGMLEAPAPPAGPAAAAPQRPLEGQPPLPPEQPAAEAGAAAGVEERPMDLFKAIFEDSEEEEEEQEEEEEAQPPLPPGPPPPEPPAAAPQAAAPPPAEDQGAFGFAKLRRPEGPDVQAGAAEAPLPAGPPPSAGPAQMDDALKERVQEALRALKRSKKEKRKKERKEKDKRSKKHKKRSSRDKERGRERDGRRRKKRGRSGSGDDSGSSSSGSDTEP